jgi:hypothetical protein
MCRGLEVWIIISTGISLQNMNGTGIFQYSEKYLTNKKNLRNNKNRNQIHVIK